MPRVFGRPTNIRDRKYRAGSTILDQKLESGEVSATCTPSAARCYTRATREESERSCRSPRIHTAAPVPGAIPSPPPVRCGPESLGLAADLSGDMHEHGVTGSPGTPARGVPLTRPPSTWDSARRGPTQAPLDPQPSVPRAAHPGERDRGRSAEACRPLERCGGVTMSDAARSPNAVVDHSLTSTERAGSKLAGAQTVDEERLLCSC